MDQPVVLFDGVCNLCNAAVQFIIKHDKKKQFRFASLQSGAGQQLMNQYNFPVNELNSFILIDDGKAYSRSTAALRVAKKIKWDIAYAVYFYGGPKNIP